MASAIGRFVAKRIFNEKIENKFGLEDPYFETVPATRLNGKPNGKTKRVRRALPPGLSKHDEEVLTKVKRRAYRLDMSFGEFLGMKFGWGSVIGIFPVAGDFADALLALSVVRTAKQVEDGLPANLTFWMYFWVVVDLIAGLIPFIGDILDTLILANTRNVISLENHLRKKGQKNLRRSGLPVPEVDPSDPDEFDRLKSQSRRDGASSRPTRQGDVSPVSAQNGSRPQSTGVTAGNTQPSQPAQAKVRDDRRGGSGGGFFGFGSKKSRPADVENQMDTADRRIAKKQGRRG